nr:hypothetical protein [Tanacetum cinerariifolium]
MRGSEYGEQDRKAAILYEYETFKANEGEQPLDTYLPKLRDVNDALGYKKKAVVLNSDPLALVAEKTNAFNQRKFYSKPINNNLRTSSTSQSANKKQEFVKTNDKKVEKKADENKWDMSKVKCYNCKKEEHFAKDCKKAKIKDYNYYKKKMLLAIKDSDEQVLSESDESSSSAEETIAEKHVEKVNQQNKDFKNQNKDLQDKYDVLINQVNTFEEKNNKFHEQTKVLNENNADLLAQTKVLKDQLQVKHVVIDTHVECHEKYAKLEKKRYEYMIRYSALFENDKKQIVYQEVLFDKMSVQLVELDKHVRDLKNTILEKVFKIFELEECVCNKDLEIE